MAEVEIYRAFSNASSNYDQNAIVQRMCATDLLDMVDVASPHNVLDVGCGTGLFTRMLAERYPCAQLVACDPSQRMLREAELRSTSACAEFVCRGTDSLPEGHWDLIASNAALHWAGGLAVTLASLRYRMAPGGTLAFSYFTRNTYAELAQAVSQAAGFDVALACGEFASPDEVEDTLSRHFTEVRVQRKVYALDFASVRELLEHIKMTGTRGTGSQPRLHWTRKLLNATQQEYLSRFGRIRATYEVVICTARQTQSS